MFTKTRTSFVGHPDAILFSRISREGVFQQPQPYAIRVHGPARNVPTPCPATGARESAGADILLLAPLVCVRPFTALVGVTVERGFDDITFETGADDMMPETGADDITPETGAEDMTLETGVDDMTLETELEGVRTI